MAKRLPGSLHLFRIFKTDVFLHWSWLIVAVLVVQYRRTEYTSMLWNALEYISLFAIILAHELGHVLACRSVGGKADRVILWPLGGIALVQPPQRPGAMLWSIAAGPLVNVALIVPLAGLLLVCLKSGQANLVVFGKYLFGMNIGLLIFNMLPIYPLDGGQILRSLLWFAFGRAPSLRIASIVGLVCIVAVGVLVVAFGGTNIFLILIALFAAMQCLAGLRQASLWSRISAAPRRPGVACPHCHAPAPAGAFWQCECNAFFDIFATGGVCPRCGGQHDFTLCHECGQSSAIYQWGVPAAQFSNTLIYQPPVVSSFNSPESWPPPPARPL